MNWENLIGYAMLVMGLAVIAVMLFSISAIAADHPADRTTGSMMEAGTALSV